MSFWLPFPPQQGSTTQTGGTPKMEASLGLPVRVPSINTQPEAHQASKSGSHSGDRVPLRPGTQDRAQQGLGLTHARDHPRIPTTKPLLSPFLVVAISSRRPGSLGQGQCDKIPLTRRRVMERPPSAVSLFVWNLLLVDSHGNAGKQQEPSHLRSLP